MYTIRVIISQIFYFNNVQVYTKNPEENKITRYLPSIS